MPKIAHFGDLHLRHDNRFEDTLRCLDHAIADAIDRDVDLFLQAGDVFDSKSTPADRNAFAERVKWMATHAPVVLIYGNHDKPGDLDIFALLETQHPVIVCDRPDDVKLAGVHVFAFPHFDKASAAAMLPAGLSIEEADESMVATVGAVIRKWRSDLELSGGNTEPAVFLGHLTIAGSILSNGEPHPNQGIQLSIGDFDAAGFDAVMLGHIHKAQVCDASGLIRYAGSISRANFGESQDPKGWWLWDIAGRGEDPVVEFLDVPARPMVTFTADWDPELGWGEDVNPAVVEGAEVRVRITVPEDRSAEAALFEAKMRSELAHAHSLQIEIRTVPVSRVRAGEIAEAKTPEDKLRAFWAATEMPDERTQAGALAKLAELVGEVG